MHIHYLQHVPFEGLGSIERWIKSRGYTLTSTRLFDNEALPELSGIDWVIVMGGPMGVFDEAQYPWLTPEKQFIKESIRQKKRMLGICLGAQLIADALGSKVKPNTYKEIGWYPVFKDKEFSKGPFSSLFPDEIEVFHWHGDTFDLPENSIRISSSEACINQGFIYEDRVIGLQFHLETTKVSTENLIIHCQSEIITAPYIQNGTFMLADEERFSAINIVMDQILDYLEALDT